MKLFRNAISRSGHPKTECMSAHKDHNPVIHDASHYPRHLQCRVKGPDGKQVALVPIWMPLSIMASHAVKAAGGSDEVASIASFAVVAQGNAIIKNIKEGVVLNEEDVLGCIDAVARNTRETLLRTVGDRQIANEVEIMIRGGGELILNSDRGDGLDDSRDDRSNSMLCEDAQSIATNVLNNFDSDMTSASYCMVSEYATNECVAKKIRKSLDSTSCTRSISSRTTTYDLTNSEPERIRPIFGRNALLPAWTWDARNATLSKQLTETSTGPVSSSDFLKCHSELRKLKQPTPSFEPTLDSSKNDSLYGTTNEASLYGTASTFNIDTFSPVLPTCHKNKSYEVAGCSKVSMDPSLGIKKSIGHDANHGENSSLFPNSISTRSAAHRGQGIFPITSNDIDIMPNHYSVTDNINDHDTEFGHSITTKSIQSVMKGKGCCSLNIKYSVPITVSRIDELMEDEISTKSPMTLTYQSYVEPGKEVDDITFLNAPANNKKSLLKRTKMLLRKLNCTKLSE
ncbi:hypothetical protein ACHAW6_004174 [Cyclotella cf. meneghiniana]